MLHNLKDVTFIIPVYIDSEERLFNLECNLRHLTGLFETNILIGEQIKDENFGLKEKLHEFGGKFDYFSLETHSQENPFYHTRLINRLLKKVETPYVCNLDCDMFLCADQYLKAVQMLRWKIAEFVLPYDDRAVHIPEEKKQTVLETIKSRPLRDDEMENLAELVWRGYSVGGGIFAVTQTYLDCGGENENFLGWGWEDHERYIRVQKLGYKVWRIPGNFYHFVHPRGATSSVNHPHYSANEKELARITNIACEDLIKEIMSWRQARFTI